MRTIHRPKTRKARRQRRHLRVRKKIQGTFPNDCAASRVYIDKRSQYRIGPPGKAGTPLNGSGTLFSMRWP